MQNTAVAWYLKMVSSTENFSTTLELSRIYNTVFRSNFDPKFNTDYTILQLVVSGYQQNSLWSSKTVLFSKLHGIFAQLCKKLLNLCANEKHSAKKVETTSRIVSICSKLSRRYDTDWFRWSIQCTGIQICTNRNWLLFEKAVRGAVVKHQRRECSKSASFSISETQLHT